MTGIEKIKRFGKLQQKFVLTLSPEQAKIYYEMLDIENEFLRKLCSKIRKEVV